MTNAASIPIEQVKGKTLRVVKGKKVPLGTEGYCVWSGPGKKAAWGDRVGIKVKGQKDLAWTAAKNCVIVDAQSAPAPKAAPQPTQLGLGFAEPEAPRPPALVWFEKLDDGVHVVAFDDEGNKLTHVRGLTIEQAKSLADKVGASGKSFADLKASEHWKAAA